MYGDPNTTTGGLALKFYACVPAGGAAGARPSRTATRPSAAEVKVKVVKNKIAPPFRTAEFALMHDRGIDWEADVLKLAVEDEVVAKSGSFYSYSDQRMGQGEKNAKAFLLENKPVCEEIVKLVLLKRKPRVLEDARIAAEEAGGGAEGPDELPEPEPTPKKRGRAAASVNGTPE